VTQKGACLGTRGSHSRARAGFSLVEAAAAIGVAAVGLSGVLAMLPLGFATARETAASNRAAHLAHRVLATVATQPADRLELFGSRLDLSRGGSAEFFSDEAGGDVRGGPFPEAVFKIHIEAGAPASPALEIPVCLTISWPPYESNCSAFVTLLSAPPR
jgi:uncharacterized protein (TIGR02598 family)